MAAPPNKTTELVKAAFTSQTFGGRIVEILGKRVSVGFVLSKTCGALNSTCLLFYGRSPYIFSTKVCHPTDRGIPAVRN